MVLKKIHAESTQAAAVKAIGAYLTGSGLRPGDRLPTELELSSRLGISRTILREALRHYRTLGIISSHPRVGMTVERLLPDDPYKCYLPFIAAASGAMREVAELRLCLESGAAELICSRIGKSDLAELRRIVDAMRTASCDKLNPLDIEFHSRLLRVTGNRMIETLIPLLVAFFRMQCPETEPDAAWLRSNAEKHLKLVEVLERRDAAEFRTRIVRHILPETQVFRKN